MRNKILVVAGLVVVIAAGTYLFVSSGEDDSVKVADHNAEAASTSIGADGSGEALDLQSIKQLVHGFSMRNISAESASISSAELVVKEDSSKSTTYELPGDEFFVSIAPYVSKTHPCAIHSLTGCQGEMVEEEFYVTVEDAEGIAVLKRQAMKSQPNGFMDLWLPRDGTYQITVEHDGKQAEAEISTFENDDTCITTMQLG